MLNNVSKNHPLLSSHLAVIENARKHNRLTFLSNITQNKMISILDELLRKIILENVFKAGKFSIIIDTTTDVSNIKQLSMIIRFVNNQGLINESLIALEIANDASGSGMFNLFCTICEKYELNWKKKLCAQSFDGAAAMQGCYSGVRTLIQQQNPRAIYVWCFSHVLNLVVVDTCDSCSEVRNFFGYIQSLKEFIRARKRTALFMQHQETIYPNDRKLRMKNF